MTKLRSIVMCLHCNEIFDVNEHKKCPKCNGVMVTTDFRKIAMRPLPEPYKEGKEDG